MTKTERKHVSNARLNYRTGFLNGVQYFHKMLDVYGDDLTAFRAWIVRAEETAKNEQMAALDVYLEAADLNTKATF